MTHETKSSQSVPAPFTKVALEKARVNWQNRNVEMYLGGGITLTGLGLIPSIGPFAAGIVCGVGLGIVRHAAGLGAAASPPLQKKVAPLIRVKLTQDQLLEKTYQAFTKAPSHPQKKSADAAAKGIFHAIAKGDANSVANKLRQFRSEHPGEFPRLLASAKELSFLLKRNQKAVAQFEAKPVKKPDAPSGNEKKAAAGVLGLGTAALGLSFLRDAPPQNPPPPNPPKKPPAKTPPNPFFNDTCPTNRDICPLGSAPRKTFSPPINPAPKLPPFFPLFDPSASPIKRPDAGIEHSNRPTSFETTQIAVQEAIPASIAIPVETTAAYIDLIAKGSIATAAVPLTMTTLRFLVQMNQQIGLRPDSPLASVLEMLKANEHLRVQNNIGFVVSIDGGEARTLQPLLEAAAQSEAGSLAAPTQIEHVFVVLTQSEIDALKQFGDVKAYPLLGRSSQPLLSVTAGQTDENSLHVLYFSLPEYSEFLGKIQGGHSVSPSGIARADMAQLSTLPNGEEIFGQSFLASTDSKGLTRLSYAEKGPSSAGSSQIEVPLATVSPYIDLIAKGSLQTAAVPLTMTTLRLLVQMPQKIPLRPDSPLASVLEMLKANEHLLAQNNIGIVVSINAGDAEALRPALQAAAESEATGLVAPDKIEHVLTVLTQSEADALQQNVDVIKTHPLLGFSTLPRLPVTKGRKAVPPLYLLHFSLPEYSAFLRQVPNGHPLSTSVISCSQPPVPSALPTGAEVSPQALPGSTDSKILNPMSLFLTDTSSADFSQIAVRDPLAASVAIPAKTTAVSLDLIAKGSIQRAAVPLTMTTLRLLVQMPQKIPLRPGSPLASVLELLKGNENLLAQNNIGIVVSIDREEALALQPALQAAAESETAGLVANTQIEYVFTVLTQSEIDEIKQMGGAALHPLLGLSTPPLLPTASNHTAGAPLYLLHFSLPQYREFVLKVPVESPISPMHSYTKLRQIAEANQAKLEALSQQVSVSDQKWIALKEKTSARRSVANLLPAPLPTHTPSTASAATEGSADTTSTPSTSPSPTAVNDPSANVPISPEPVSLWDWLPSFPTLPSLGFGIFKSEEIPATPLSENTPLSNSPSPTPSKASPSSTDLLPSPSTLQSIGLGTPKASKAFVLSPSPTPSPISTSWTDSLPSLSMTSWLPSLSTLKSIVFGTQTASETPLLNPAQSPEPAEAGNKPYMEEVKQPLQMLPPLFTDDPESKICVRPSLAQAWGLSQSPLRNALPPLPGVNSPLSLPSPENAPTSSAAPLSQETDPDPAQLLVPAIGAAVSLAVRMSKEVGSPPPFSIEDLFGQKDLNISTCSAADAPIDERSAPADTSEWTRVLGETAPSSSETPLKQESDTAPHASLNLMNSQLQVGETLPLTDELGRNASLEISQYGPFADAFRFPESYTFYLSNEPQPKLWQTANLNISAGNTTLPFYVARQPNEGASVDPVETGLSVIEGEGNSQPASTEESFAIYNTLQWFGGNASGALGQLSNLVSSALNAVLKTPPKVAHSNEKAIVLRQQGFSESNQTPAAQLENRIVLVEGQRDPAIQEAEQPPILLVVNPQNPSEFAIRLPAEKFKSLQIPLSDWTAALPKSLAETQVALIPPKSSGKREALTLIFTCENPEQANLHIEFLKNLLVHPENPVTIPSPSVTSRIVQENNLEHLKSAEMPLQNLPGLPAAFALRQAVVHPTDFGTKPMPKAKDSRSGQKKNILWSGSAKKQPVCLPGDWLTLAAESNFTSAIPGKPPLQGIPQGIPNSADKIDNDVANRQTPEDGSGERKSASDQPHLLMKEEKLNEALRQQALTDAQIAENNDRQQARLQAQAEKNLEEALRRQAETNAALAQIQERRDSRQNADPVSEGNPTNEPQIPVRIEKQEERPSEPSGNPPHDSGSPDGGEAAFKKFSEQTAETDAKIAALNARRAARKARQEQRN